MQSDQDNGQEVQLKRESVQLPVQNHIHFNVPPPTSQEQLVEAVRQGCRRPRGRARFFLARLMRFAWELGMGVLLGYVNLTVVSAGWAEISPAYFAIKASSLPGLGWMAGYLMFNKITTAQVLAVGLFIVLTVTWKFVVKDLLRSGGAKTFTPRGWDPDRSRLFWRTTCGLLMICDAGFFYGIMHTSSWSSQPSYVAAMFMTIVYLVWVAVYNGMSLHLTDWEGDE